MYLSRRISAVAIALAVVAAFWPFPPAVEVVAAVVLLAALAFVDRQSAPKADRLRLVVEAPRTCVVGQKAAVQVGLHNPAPRRLRGRLHLEVGPSLRRHPPRLDFDLDPGQWAELEFDLSPAARGSRSVGPATVRTLGRWGLAGRQQVVQIVCRIKVYPKMPGRARVARMIERPLLLRSGLRAAVAAGEGTTFDTLRKYHPDDEFRRINWRATARAGEPVTNTYREESNQRVLILVDAGRTMAASIEGTTRFEYAMDSCVALTDLGVRLGDQVGMMALAGEPLAVVAPGSGRAHGQVILDQLFDLEPSLGASNYRRGFSVLLERFSRRALLVLLTELTEPAAMQSLLDALPSVVRRHLVVVASLTDPAVADLLGRQPKNAQESYLRAAAESWVFGREQAAGALRSMGARVVDETPEALPGRLADEYLRLKAFGRL